MARLTNEKRFWKMYAKLNDKEKFCCAVKMVVDRIDGSVSQTQSMLRNIQFLQPEKISLKEMEEKMPKYNEYSSNLFDSMKYIMDNIERDRTDYLLDNYIKKERGNTSKKVIYTKKRYVMDRIIKNPNFNKLKLDSDYVFQNEKHIKQAKKCFLANGDTARAEVCDKILVLKKLKINND